MPSGGISTVSSPQPEQPPNLPQMRQEQRMRGQKCPDRWRPRQGVYHYSMEPLKFHPAASHLTGRDQGAQGERVSLQLTELYE